MNPITDEHVEKTSEEKRGERRERLREFQSQLFERMQVARGSEVASKNQLGVLIGQTHYLLNLKEAGEIFSVGKIYPVPLTQDWYLGLINIRGNLIGVVDVERFHGGDVVEVNPECRIIAFSDSLTFNAGLLVTKVLGLRSVDDMTIQTNSVDDTPLWMRLSYVDSNDQVWHELNLSKLIEDSKFLHISA